MKAITIMKTMASTGAVLFAVGAFAQANPTFPGQIPTTGGEDAGLYDKPTHSMPAAKSSTTATTTTTSPASPYDDSTTSGSTTSGATTNTAPAAGTTGHKGHGTATTGTTDMTGAAGASGTSAGMTGGPSDAEIAHIVTTANTIDVDSGKLAQTKAASKDVKDYAKMMVNDHTSSNKEAMALAKKLGVQPKDNETSKSLKTSANETMKSLKGLKGAEFDKAYMAQEVAFHQKVLDTINNTLEPSAKNPDLKAQIIKTKPVIEAHLEHAKKVQEKVGQM